MTVFMSAADTIGRRLARLGHLRSSDTAEPDTSRETIAQILAEAGRPLNVEDIAAVTRLHVNTVRTHLDVLRAAGRVERFRQQSEGRGRPKWLYRATVTDDPYRRLADELSNALTAAESPDFAHEAATRWREAEHVSREPARSPDAAVTAAAHALSQLGFAVDVSPVGDAVYLGQCPYAALVAEHPVICDIHARALEQVLAGTGQDVHLESLDVFARPGVCVARLRRPDAEPAWTVPGSDPESAKPKSGPKTTKKQSRRGTA